MSRTRARVKQGRIGEAEFGEWLNDNEFGFIPIRQNKDDLAHVFQGALKRPDFLILLPSLGLIAIDVKNHTLSRNRFSINIPQDLAKAVEFENQFKLYLWYACRIANGDGSAWYFISALRAIEHGERHTNSGTGEDFLYIPVEEFTEVRTGDDMLKLFSRRIGRIGAMARLVENYFSAARLKA